MPWKAAGSLGGILGPLRALGECCGLRIRVRISGSCFGSAAATVAGAGWIRCGDLRVVNLS